MGRRTRVVLDPAGIEHLGRIANMIAYAVADDILDDMRRVTPVDTGALMRSERIKRRTRKPTVRGDARARIWIGTDHWRFVEYGTRYMRAQPYIRPSVYKKRVIRMVEATL